MPTLARLAYTRAHSDVSVTTINAIGDVLYPDPVTSNTLAASTGIIVKEAAESTHHVPAPKDKAGDSEKKRMELTVTGKLAGWMCVFGRHKGC
jgi:hypothetical protein